MNCAGIFSDQSSGFEPANSLDYVSYLISLTIAIAHNAQLTLKSAKALQYESDVSFYSAYLWSFSITTNSNHYLATLVTSLA